MIHLSRFLIGVRHKRLFRFRDMSGKLIDRFVEIYSDKFNSVNVNQSGDDFTLVSDVTPIAARFNRDDVIVDFPKRYDSQNKKYIEVDKAETIDIAEDAINITSEILSIENNYQRLGMIFEYKIPSNEITTNNIGDFIKRQFINFEHGDGSAGNGSFRYTYKIKVAEAIADKKIKDFRNIIVVLEESTGIAEDGTIAECLQLHVDLQRMYDPPKKKIDVKEHYDFAVGHLNNIVLPNLRNLGIPIEW